MKLSGSQPGNVEPLFTTATLTTCNNWRHSLAHMSWWSKFAAGKLATCVLLAAAYWVVAAAAFGGYVGKWGLRDGSTGFSAETLLDGSANRPWVYRQLIPQLARTLDAIAPESARNYAIARVRPEATFTRVRKQADASIQFERLVMLYASFVAVFASLFILRRVLLEAGVPRMESFAAPIVAMLAFPFLQTVGGYFYDFPEIMCFAAAVLFAMRGHWLALAVLSLPATLNKESFLVFLLSLLPFFLRRFSAAQAVVRLLPSLVIALLVNIALKIVYSGNPGGALQYHLGENLGSYLSRATYLSVESTYGVPGPAMLSLVFVLLVALVAARSWRRCTIEVRRHLLLAGLLNAPLFIAFAAPGELRNLSFLFVAAVILVAKCLMVDGTGIEPVTPAV